MLNLIILKNIWIMIDSKKKPDLPDIKQLRTVTKPVLNLDIVKLDDFIIKHPMNHKKEDSIQSINLSQETHINQYDLALKAPSLTPKPLVTASEPPLEYQKPTEEMVVKTSPWQNFKNKIQKMFSAPITGRIISVGASLFGFVLAGFFSGGIIPLAGVVVSLIATVHGIYHDTREELKHTQLLKEKTYVDDYINANNEISKIAKNSPHLAEFISEPKAVGKNKEYPPLGRMEPYFSNSLSKAAWNGFLELIGPITVALFKPVQSLIIACVSGLFTFGFASKSRYEQDIEKYDLKKLLTYQRTKVPIYKSIGELNKKSMEKIAEAMALTMLEREEKPSKELFDKYYSKAITEILSHSSYSPEKVTNFSSKATFSDKLDAFKNVMSFDYKRDDIKRFKEVKEKNIGTNIFQDMVNNIPKSLVRAKSNNLSPQETPVNIDKPIVKGK